MQDFVIRSAVEGYSQYISQIKGIENATNKALNGVSKTATTSKKSLSELGNQFPALGRAASLIANPIALGTAALVGIAAGAVKATKAAAEFENQFLELRQLNIGKAPEQIAALRDDILSLSLETGLAAGQVSQAFFDVQSGTGLFGAEVAEVVKTVGTFARATKQDLPDAINGAVKAIRQYGLEVKDLDGFLASQYALIQQGIVTYEQAAKVTVEYGNAAAGAGQNIDDANKIFALFTAGSKSANEAATLTKTAFEDLAKKQTLDNLGKYVEIFDSVTGEAREIDDIIRDLVPQFQALSDKEFSNLISAIGGSQGLRGLLTQVRTQGEGVLRVFDGFEDAKGKFDFGNILKSAEGDFVQLSEIVKNQFNTLLIQAGTEILPIVATRLNDLSKALQDANKWFTENNYVIDLLSAGISKITGLFGGLETEVNNAKVAFAILGGPLTLIKFAIDGINSAIDFTIRKFRQLAAEAYNAIPLIEAFGFSNQGVLKALRDFSQGGGAGAGAGFGKLTFEAEKFTGVLGPLYLALFKVRQEKDKLFKPPPKPPKPPGGGTPLGFKFKGEDEFIKGLSDSPFGFNFENGQLFIEAGLTFNLEGGGESFVTALEGPTSSIENMQMKLEDLKDAIIETGLNDLARGFERVGAAIGSGASAAEIGITALQALGDAVLVQVPKYLGLFLIKEALTTPPPLSFAMAAAGVALVGLSGLAGGLLGRLGGGNEVGGQGNIPRSSPGAGAAPSGGLGSFSGDGQDFQPVFNVYVGNEQVAGVVTRQQTRQRVLQGA